MRLETQLLFRLFGQKAKNSTTRKNRKIGLPLRKIGGQERDRTADTRIFSPLLYQLSYLANDLEMVGAQGFEPWTQ